MTFPALVAVLLVARVAVVWGRPLEWTPMLVVACLGQDALVALAFAVLERMGLLVRWGGRASTTVFWLVVGYLAINLVVARVLPTPLTWPMLRATGGPIADSLTFYVTPTSVALLALVGIAAALMLPISRRVPTRVVLALTVALAAVAVAGNVAIRRVETWGLHRNAFVTLITSALPVVDARTSLDDWREPREPREPANLANAADLAHLRGIAEGRNLVVIGLESTGAQYLKLYGAAESVTPRLDDLAKHAVVYDRSYAVSPDSIRSLFSVLCSRYPAFDVSLHAYVSAPCQSVAGALQRRGYRTALFHSGRFGYLGMEGVVRNRGFDVLEDAGHVGGNHESSFGVDEPATVARMLAWIDALGPLSRFAVTYMPVAGHHPYATTRPGVFGDATELDRYRSALHEGDESLGALIDGLMRRRLFDQTMFVVYGDHGQAFGQHPGNVGHTFFLFEENVRVPFFVALPGALHAQYRSDVVVSLVDVAPTVYELMGLPASDKHLGRSALNPEPRTALFFTDYGERLAGLRDGRWKFILDLSTSRARLFDLDRDSAEQRDLSIQEPQRAADYARIVRGWSSAQKALMSDPPPRSLPVGRP